MNFVFQLNIEAVVTATAMLPYFLLLVFNYFYFSALLLVLPLLIDALTAIALSMPSLPLLH
jgi:hypothetical protein